MPYNIVPIATDECLKTTQLYYRSAWCSLRQYTANPQTLLCLQDIKLYYSLEILAQLQKVDIAMILTTASVVNPTLVKTVRLVGFQHH